MNECSLHNIYRWDDQQDEQHPVLQLGAAAEIRKITVPDQAELDLWDDQQFEDYIEENQRDLLLEAHVKWHELRALRPYKKTSRGRPAKFGIRETSPSQLSPRMLAQCDLVDVAQDWSEIVSHVRSLSLCKARTSATPKVAAMDRAKRIAIISEWLKAPENARRSTHPNCKIALHITGLRCFANVKLDTLRKDIAKAKKQIWHAHIAIN
jgi:hypothetical protein